MNTDNERHEALGEAIKQAAIAAGLYYPPTSATPADTYAAQYERSARAGYYRGHAGVTPAFPGMFGMTSEQFDALRKLIYPEK